MTALPSSFLRHTLALFVALLVPSFVQAQGDATDPASAEYEKAVREAVQEFSLGNYAEARARFLQAHEVYPNARTLRGLGKVEYELRNYHRSIEYLEQSLVSEQRPLTQTMRQEVESLLAKARGYVGQVEFQVTPPDAEVTIDGVDRELSGSGKVMLDVGEHTALIRAPGHQTSRMRIEVTGGQTRVVEVSLVPNGGVSEGALASDDTASEVPRRRKRWAWALSAVAVVAGAGLAAGLALRPDGEAAPSGGSTGIVLSLPE